MRKIKRFFYLIYFLFLAVTILGSFNSEYIFHHWGILGSIKFIKWWFLFGGVLFCLEWLIENIHINNLKQEIKKLEKTKEEIKARLFDLRNRGKEKKNVIVEAKQQTLK